MTDIDRDTIDRCILTISMGDYCRCYGVDEKLFEPRYVSILARLNIEGLEGKWSNVEDGMKASLYRVLMTKGGKAVVDTRFDVVDEKSTEIENQKAGPLIHIYGTALIPRDNSNSVRDDNNLIVADNDRNRGN
jgi:hypothetical protein